MKIAPDTTIRVATAEAVSLELDVTAELGEALITPRIGDAIAIPLDDNAFDMPPLVAPNTALIEWRASGSDETAFTNYAEVVSRHYFTIDQLREYGGGRDDFDELPDEVLWAARQAATDVFEEAAHRSFVERYGRTKDFGRTDQLVLDHRDIREVLTAGYIQAGDSRLDRMPAIGPYPKWVEYRYGAEQMPAEVSRAVLELAAYMLRPTNRPIGATGESTDAGYIHFTTAGRDGWTSIPEVNAAIDMFGAWGRMAW